MCPKLTGENWGVLFFNGDHIPRYMWNLFKEQVLESFSILSTVSGHFFFNFHCSSFQMCYLSKFSTLDEDYLSI